MLLRSINILASVCLVNAYQPLADSDGHFRIEVDKYRELDELSFGILGDWGGFPAPWYNTPFQLSAAKALGQVSAEKQSKFTMAIGDNFYFWGVKDIYDERWYTTWEKVYTDASLQEPWYVCAGNHDWQGNVTAQIAYSKYNQRWTFPDFYYTVKYRFAGDKVLTMIFIDTQMLCDQGQTEINKQYPTPVTEQMKIDELAWLRAELEATANDDYVIVVGHYQCHTPNKPLSCMKPVDEMLHEYNVNAYINGHIHNQIHMSSKTPSSNNSTVHYLETGMGALVTIFGVPKPPYNNQEIDVNFSYAKLFGFYGAFGMATATADSITFDWYVATDSEPKLQYSAKIDSRNKYKLN